MELKTRKAQSRVQIHLCRPDLRKNPLGLERPLPTSNRGAKWRILSIFEHLYSSVNPALRAGALSRQSIVDDEPWANSKAKPIVNDDWKKASRGAFINEKRQVSSPGPTNMVACRGYDQLRGALPAIRAEHALSPYYNMRPVSDVGRLSITLVNLGVTHKFNRDRH
jgi:hypothetical protein